MKTPCMSILLVDRDTSVLRWWKGEKDTPGMSILMVVEKEHFHVGGGGKGYTLHVQL
jgi:hypothetical protein